MRHPIFLIGATVLSVSLLCAAVEAQVTQLYWGDTHVHTKISMDAYMTGTFNADPDTAYRFAKGQPVLHTSLRTRVQIDRPLDFLVVADHAENLGLQAEVMAGNPVFLATAWGKALREALEKEQARGLRNLKPEDREAMNADMKKPEFRQGTWEGQVDAAERHNDPGRFTTFAGWEWTVHPGGKNLHRVVFTTAGGAAAKSFLPYNSNDSQKPEELWQWLEKTSAATGAKFIAIPHNSNISGGLMFDLVDSDSRPFTAAYARERARWEPVIEMTQVKGTSEVHPELSPNDEFADFEIRRKLLAGAATPANKADYARSALLRGLEVEQSIGVNPYRFGLIGSSDTHTALTSVAENNFLGKLATDALPEERHNSKIIFPAWEMSAGGLAGVWASANTRDDLMAAFQRKEVYATSGPRIALRVFGGFSFAPKDARAKDIAAIGYRKGVPMGGDLTAAPGKRAPSLLIHAAKDPLSGNLDRIQVIKGWLNAAGKAEERVFDVTWSGDRKPDTTGKLPPVGNTVDITTAGYTDTIGAAQLAAVWQDPEFDPGQRAFYYVRVIEIPTPRHTLYDAVALGIDVEETKQPATIQERAWSSPIWYTP
ncbi:MAG: DUF3604 domain-containing protein [Gammaproteobacteria bacterium]|nr:MAG: DUF3604 domain-containing protein [Gammaproteobacteria bacterium]